MSERSDINRGVRAAKKGDYLLAINLLTDAYAEGEFTFKDSKSVEGLSYYGLCLAMVQRKYKEAIDICKRTLALNFYSPRHYENLARVYMAASMRKKAVDTAEDGLKKFPDDKGLTAVRKELGVRARPAIPFLERSNPVNEALGRSRHSKKKSDVKEARETSED